MQNKCNFQFLAVSLITIGCTSSKIQSEQNVRRIQNHFSARNFDGISKILAPEPGYAFGPNDAELFLKAYASGSLRMITLKEIAPKPGDRSNTSVKLNYSITLDGVQQKYPVTFSALSAGEGRWITPVSQVVDTAIGLYYSTSEERLAHISSALRTTGIKCYGKAGHFTDADRIDSYLSGKLAKNRLYYANLP